MTLQQCIKGARRPKKFRSKTPAFQGCPQRRGTIVRLDLDTSPKKPNSAKRKVAKVSIKGSTDLMAYIPGRGHNLQKYSAVLVRGGRVPDLPGVRYHLFRNKLDFTMSEVFNRMARRSKFGAKKERPHD